MEIYALVAFIAIVALFLSYKIYLTDKEVDGVKERVDSHATRIARLEHLVEAEKNAHEAEMCDICEKYDDRLADIDAIIGETTNAADMKSIEELQHVVQAILNSWNVSVPYLMDFMKTIAEKRKDVRDIWEQAERARTGEGNTNEIPAEEQRSNADDK